MLCLSEMQKCLSSAFSPLIPVHSHGSIFPLSDLLPLVFTGISTGTKVRFTNTITAISQYFPQLPYTKANLPPDILTWTPSDCKNFLSESLKVRFLYSNFKSQGEALTSTLLGLDNFSALESLLSICFYCDMQERKSLSND